jgi:predicted nucleic acid-binding OB-fold protein
MVYKLIEQAEKHWRRLNKSELITLVIHGVEFVDGVIKKEA